MKNPKQKKYTPLLAALATLIVLLAAVVLLWLAEVRPQVTKGRSEIITDFLRAELIHDGETAEQVFTYDKDLLTIGLEFYLPGEQPSGALEVVLYDADTGAELSRSVGTMDYIVPDQYTTLGLDPAVTGREGRRYRLTVTPHYTTDAILAVGHSDGVALWKEQMSVSGRAVDGTMAMQITYQRIGGYLTRFFLLVAGLAAVLAAFAVWTVLGKKLALHRLVFVLVLGFGLLYSFVLPPYAAPDEKYHINQSFTLASRWANDLSREEWRMGRVPTTTTFRRVGDEDADLQNENTTVFTWEAFTSQLLTTTEEPFDSHQEYNELQTDQNPLLYLASAAAVFLAYLLHLGFAPALLLGRLANLLLFAALAALAVALAPAAVRGLLACIALLPMPLQLAGSLSPDASVLGMVFCYTALCLRLRTKKAVWWEKILLIALGGAVGPAKAIYLPVVLLCLIIPAENLAGPQEYVRGPFGLRVRSGRLIQAATLVLAFGLWLTANLGALAYAARDVSRAVLAAGVAALAVMLVLVLRLYAWARTDACRLRRVRRGLTAAAAAAVLGGVFALSRMGGGLDPDQLLMTNPNGDSIWTFSLGYICRNLPATAKLLLRTIPAQGALWLQGVLGTTLGEPIVYRLDVSWLLGVGLVLALLAAALPVQGEQPLLGGRAAWGTAGIILCVVAASLVVALNWTPINYQTLFGLQGRYWLPVLPLALVLCKRAGNISLRRNASRGAALAVTACTLLTLLQGYSLYASWQPVS